MARRQAREQSSSLFPFLSVLACVIGTLTLLIASLAIGQVAESLLDSRDDVAWAYTGHMVLLHGTPQPELQHVQTFDQSAVEVRRDVGQ